LRSEGVPFNSYTCNDAAREGHLDVLKYLKSEGEEFDEETCYAATSREKYATTKGQKLKVLQWLVGEGCEWNVKWCYECAKAIDPDSDICKWIYLIDKFLPS
jgi:hypothetical protein